MRLRMILSLFVVALTAVTSAAAVQHKPAGHEPDHVSGEWEVTFKIGGGSASGTLTLKIDGDKVTGTVESQHTGPGTLSDGSYADGKLSFTMNFAAHESIAATGGLKGDELIGEFRTEGMQGTWEAKRKAAPSSASARAASGAPAASGASSSSSADPISGQWDGSFAAGGSTAPVTLKLRLDGGKVTGTTESSHLGNGTVSNGSWADNKLSFNIDGAHGTIAITSVLKDGKLVGEFAAGATKGKLEATKK
jgi:hypothetical protein